MAGAASLRKRRAKRASVKSGFCFIDGRASCQARIFLRAEGGFALSGYSQTLGHGSDCVVAKERCLARQLRMKRAFLPNCSLAMDFMADSGLLGLGAPCPPDLVHPRTVLITRPNGRKRKDSKQAQNKAANHAHRCRKRRQHLFQVMFYCYDGQTGKLLRLPK